MIEALAFSLFVFSVLLYAWPRARDCEDREWRRRNRVSPQLPRTLAEFHARREEGH